MTESEIHSLPRPYSATHEGLMCRLAFILLTLSLSLTGQEKPSPRTPEAIPWHSLATGLPPATISGPPTSLTFENQTTRTVKVFWIKYNGTLKAYGELHAGATREQKTTAKSCWMIAETSGKPLGYFEATPRPGRAIISARLPVPILRSRKYTPGTKKEAILWQKKLRASLARLMKMEDLIAQDSPLPLNSTTSSSEDRGKFILHEMEIDSTPGNRIKLILTVPKVVTGTCPAVVAIAGHSGTRHSCYRDRGFATLLAEKGYVTISTRISQHSVREQRRTMMGERLWDLIRCVDLLVSRREVDPARIGCAGNSLGGEMAMWLAAMDERIAATMSAGFLTSMDQLEENHCRCWKFPGLRELVEFSDIYALTATRPLMCQNGLQERPTWFTVPLAREALARIRPIYEVFEAPENLEFVAHQGGHVIEIPSLLTFLGKHLGPEQ